MNVARLRRLGRRLIELSRTAAGPTKGPALTPGEEAVFEDVLRHPGSAVGEIQARTGFVQSHVSASVARLRERGLLATAPDPGDGRRTQVRITDLAARAVSRRAARPVDEAIRMALDDEARVARVMALLAELEELLFPDVLPGHASAPPRPGRPGTAGRASRGTPLDRPSGGGQAATEEDAT